jgi:hypothetical protein
MNTHELIQQFIAAGVPIDTAWNMFIFVHITLVGGIYAMKRRMTWVERGFVSVLYSVFGWINWNALTGAYRLYDSILMDIRAAGKGESLYTRTVQFLSSYDVGDRAVMVTAIHLSAWALVMLFIATEERLVPHKRAEGAA